MITDPQEQIIVSSLGWVDQCSLWTLDIRSGRQANIRIGEAKYLSLHRGTDGCFAAVHHFDSVRLELTAHHFSDPGRIVSRRTVAGENRSIEGDADIWSSLPRHYVAHLVQSDWTDFVLLSIEGDALILQTFEWYGDDYDKDYQGICGVTEVPGSQLVLVSVQRDSNPVLFDPVAGRKVRQITLAERRGNPEFFFCRTAQELWASDYDTILKIDPGNWQVIAQRKLQEGGAHEARFMGNFNFDATEKVCAVARPFGGDVVGIDPGSLEIRHRVALGQQPLEVAVLGDLRVFARDWHTGALLQGELAPTPSS